MNTTISILLFAVFILLYSVIIEIFTILFRLTGLTNEKARTQVISLLTNSGFTTSESEVILSSRKRRTLAQLTMLFGYSFTVIIVSIVVNVFISLSITEISHLLPAIIGIAIAIMLFLIIFRIAPVRNGLDHLIERAGTRIMYGRNSNPILLIDIYAKNAVVEVLLEYIPLRFEGMPLSCSGLSETMGIHVLHIKRRETPDVKIDGGTVLEAGDVILLFGDYKSIRRMFGQQQIKN